MDDTPYGGGAGMVMKPDPWGAALDELAGDNAPRLLIMTPAGRPFTQRLAEELATEDHLIFGCGRYEGIDARVAVDAARRMRVDEISIGDYVLNGGEAAALVIIEAVVRLLPGVIGNPESLTEESHAPGQDHLLEYPVYTKPPSWRGLDVPEILFSGHHAKIAGWRREQAERLTRDRRPDLLPSPRAAEGAGSAEVVITEADPSDAGEIVTVQRAAFVTEARLNQTHDIPALQQTATDMIALMSDSTMLAARSGNRLVGAVLGQSRQDRDTGRRFWYIGRLVVAPDQQGRGIGARLLTEIERRAPADCHAARLHTGAASEPNLAFYARRGYRVIGQDLYGDVPLATLEKTLPADPDQS